MDRIVMDFLEDLQLNNNRDWFNANKDRYEEAKATMEKFVDKLIPGLLRIDPSIGTLTAKQTMFRIYRDVRFSKDKSPYKLHFGAFMAQGGRKSDKAGYYLHVGVDDCFIGGGSHSPSGEQLKKIRSEIYYNVDEFKAIINNKKFAQTFRIFEDDKLKRPPQGFPADFPDVELLKYKHYTVFQPMDKNRVINDDFDKHVLKVFETMKPFITFLNRALDG